MNIRKYRRSETFYGEPFKENHKGTFFFKLGTSSHILSIVFCNSGMTRDFSAYISSNMVNSWQKQFLPLLSIFPN